jgi:hypothetical protein
VPAIQPSQCLILGQACGVHQSMVPKSKIFGFGIMWSNDMQSPPIHACRAHDLDIIAYST